MNIYTMPLSETDLEALYIQMEKENPTPGRKPGKRRNNQDLISRTGHVRKVVPDDYSILRGLKCQIVSL
ncbi:hypothetical protein KAR91_67515 [Candidatus Pacearchaeota archaeon]|nr:hypothetical protein [Candidatus Pacearchaeota archaeon]